MSFKKKLEEKMLDAESPDDRKQVKKIRKTKG